MKEIHGSTHGCELLDLESPSIAAQLLSRVQLFATPWTGAHQAPLSMEFPGENTGVGCHFLLQVIFPTQGLNPSIAAQLCNYSKLWL